MRSALFWFCLVLAAGMYGSVALAPKLLAFLQVREEYCINQMRLVELERQVSHLGRVVGALQTEPEFATQLARIEFGAAAPGEERIPVGPELALDGRSGSPRRAAAARSDWLVAAITPLASNRAVRRSLLAAAALIVVAAFGFCQESPVDRSTTPAPPKLGWLLRRYGRSE